MTFPLINVCQSITHSITRVKERKDAWISTAPIGSTRSIIADVLGSEARSKPPKPMCIGLGVYFIKKFIEKLIHYLLGICYII